MGNEDAVGHGNSGGSRGGQVTVGNQVDRPGTGGGPAVRVERWDGAQVRDRAGDLAVLLRDTVDSGASVGFLAPLGHAEAVAWWRKRADAAAAGDLLVWAAVDPAGRVAGTVGLALPGSPNSRHRAELVKLMVHRSARGQGLGRLLLATAERAAAAAGRTLLHLDTETGSRAELLYRSAGWTVAGTIPDYAAGPAGELRPTTLYYKRLVAPDG